MKEQLLKSIGRFGSLTALCRCWPGSTNLSVFCGLGALCESYRAAMLPMSAQAFLYTIGIIAIVAGLTVLLGFTWLGAMVVVAWLAGI